MLLTLARTTSTSLVHLITDLSRYLEVKMKWSLATLGFIATAYALPSEGGAVTEAIKPKGDSPQGCSASRDGKFSVTINRLGAAKRSIKVNQSKAAYKNWALTLQQKRSCDGPNTLVVTLKDGVLKDAKDRTGYVASNFQFQFDGPPQSGALITAGFSACSNGSLALGPSTVFYQCLSGDFYNLYDRNWAPQCEPVEIIAESCDGSSNGSEKTVGTKIVVTTVVTVLADGQPQVVPTTIAIPMCQIGDGQVQVHTTPCGGAPATASHPPVSRPPVSRPPVSRPHISQAPSAPPVSRPVSHPPVSRPPPTQPSVPTTTAAPPAAPSVPASGSTKAFPAMAAALLVAALSGVIAL